MVRGFRTRAAAVAALLLAGCGGGRQAVRTSGPAAPPAAGEVITVEAEGQANVVEGNALATKDVALLAAQKAAVEKAVGVIVSGQMVVSQARLIEDQVFSKTAGYLTAWKVLAEHEEDGLHTTKIRADVKLGDVRKDLDALGLLIRTKKVGNPRIMVLVDERVDGAPSPSKTVETGLAKALLDKGYKVVDSEQLAENAKQEDILKALKGDEAEAAGLGKKLGAEICLVGTIDARLLGGGKTDAAGESALGDMATYRGRLNLKAVKTSSGQVVLAEARDAAGMDLTKEGAAVRCLANAAEEAGPGLADKLAPALFEGAEVQLALAGVGSFDALQGVLKSVRAADGVRGIVTRSFSPAETVLDVDLAGGNATTLAAQLETRKAPAFDIKEVAAYRIAAALRP